MSATGSSDAAVERSPCHRCVPPRGGGRRSPLALPPPAAAAAAASPNPGPGLLVQHQLRLLGRRRHLSLCGKMRPFGWLGPSLGRSSPGPSTEGRVPNFSRHPQSRRRHSPEARTHLGPDKSDQIIPETHSLVPCASNRGDVGSARRPRVTRRSVRYSAPTAPLRSPLFAFGPGSHGARALLSRLYLAAGRGGGQRVVLGRLRSGGASGPITQMGAAETVHHCSRVPETKQGHLPQR